MTKTLIVWIGVLEDRPEGAVYPTRLYFEPDTTANWRDGQRQAEGRIPLDRVAGIDPVNAPVPPGGNGLAAAGMEAWKQTGCHLHALLAEGGLADAIDRLRAEHENAVRIVFEIDPPDLQRLPWELLYHENAIYAQLMPVVRGHIDLARPLTVERWPLRVLLVVGCQEDDLRIKAEDEVAAIEEVLRALPFTMYHEVLRRPTRQVLADELRRFRPHVLHFIGHGQAADGQGGGTLEIAVKPPDQEPYVWSLKAEVILVDFQRWKPRFVFLNACGSAAAEAAAENGAAWMVAEAFLKAGVPAVFGMRGDVDGRAALLYAKGFYEALGRGESLDIAICEARKTVTRQFDNARTCHWALGSLLVGSPPGDVLHLEPAHQLPARAAIKAEYGVPEDFVDRRTERRRLWEHLGVLPSEAMGKPPLLLIGGESQIGKSAFVRTCVGGCAMRGHRVAFLEGERETISFVELLRRIRDAVCALPSTAGAAVAFAEFDHVLACAIDGAVLADVPPAQWRRDDGRLWAGGEPNLAKAVFQAFRQALAAAATPDEPLCVVLDHIKLDDGEVKAYLFGGLFREIALGRVANVRLIFVENAVGQNHGLALLRQGVDRIELQKFPATEYAELAREYFSYHGEIDQKNRRAVDFLTPHVPWSMTLLRGLLGILVSYQGNAPSCP